MIDRKPLLSICIPTYNRSSFLRVMLQALLPQVAECGEQVEVWVLDNASTDDTPEALEAAKVLGPFKVKRQSANVGSVRNVIDGPLTLAKGRFVWVLGDHNLLRMGALKRVVERLNAEAEVEVFYANFRLALFPQDWPQDAIGGYDGSFHYVGNQEVTEGVVAQWHQLIGSHSAACTQVYVHIVATRVWREFWRDGVDGQDYTCALTTYPHTMMLINSAMHKPAMVLADPVITVYSGAQSWGNPVTRIKVYFVGLPELLKELHRQGLPIDRIKFLWQLFFVPEAINLIRTACHQLGRMPALLMILKHIGSNFWSWRVLVGLLPEILLPRFTVVVRRLVSWAGSYSNWYLYNCRPARYIRRVRFLDKARPTPDRPSLDR